MERCGTASSSRRPRTSQSAATSSSRRPRTSSAASSFEMTYGDDDAQQLIRQLEEENRNLLRELNNTEEDAEPDEIPAAIFELQKLEDEADYYSRKVENERNRGEELDKQIAIVKDKVEWQLKTKGGVKVSQENNKLMGRQLRILENKIDEKTKQFNMSLLNNKKLKQKIDDKRRERVVYDRVYRQQEMKLLKVEKQQKKIKKRLEEARRENEAAKNNLEDLMAKERQQKAEHKKLVHSIKQEIANNKKKWEKKMMAVRVVSKAPPKRRRDQDRCTRIDKTIEMEFVEPEVKEQLEKFEKMMEDIYKNTPVKNVDEFVREAMSREVVAEDLVKELEFEQNRLKEMEEENEDLKTLSKLPCGDDTTGKEIAKRFEDRLEMMKAERKKVDEQVERARSEMLEMAGPLAQLFDSLGLPDDPALGITKGGSIDESNIMRYVSYMDVHVEEELKLAAIREERETRLSRSSPSPSLLSPSGMMMRSTDTFPALLDARSPNQSDI